MPTLKKAQFAELQPLLPELDAIGLTCHLHAAFKRLEAVPNDYLLNARAWAGAKPLLLTSATLKASQQPGERVANDVGFLRRLLQLLYWLDAELVAYPQVTATQKDPELAERAKDADHPALGEWADVPRWKRVQSLTAGHGTLAAPPAPTEPAGSPPRP